MASTRVTNYFREKSEVVQQRFADVTNHLKVCCFYFFMVIGVVCGLVGLAAMLVQATLNRHLGVWGFFVFALPALGGVWLGVAVSDAKDFRTRLNRRDHWVTKSLIFVLIVLGSMFILNWDKISSYWDPLIFIGCSLSWFIFLCLIRPRTDHGILSFLLTAASVRALACFTFRHWVTVLVFCSSCVIGVVRHILESRDPDGV